MAADEGGELEGGAAADFYLVDVGLVARGDGIEEIIIIIGSSAEDGVIRSAAALDGGGDFGCGGVVDKGEDATGIGGGLEVLLAVGEESGEVRDEAKADEELREVPESW